MVYYYLSEIHIQNSLQNSARDTVFKLDLVGGALVI
jgi:hypothetical protein